MERLQEIFARTAAVFQRFLADAKEGLAHDAPGLVGVLETATRPPAPAVPGPSPEATLFILLAQERGFREQVQRASAAAARAPEWWLRPFSDTRQESSRALRQEAAQAFRAYAEAAGTLRGELVAGVAAGLTAGGPLTPARVAGWARQHPAAEVLALAGGALARSGPAPELREAVARLRTTVLAEDAARLVPVHNDGTGPDAPGIGVALLTMGDRGAVTKSDGRAEWQAQLAPAGAFVYDPRLLYDTRALESAGIRADPLRGIDPDAARRFKILVHAPAAPRDERPNVVGVGGMCPSARCGRRPLVVSVGQSSQTVVPRLDPAAEAAFNSCIQLAAASFLDTRWIEHKAVHDERRAAESAPLHAFERVAGPALAAAAAAAAAGLPPGISAAALMGAEAPTWWDTLQEMFLGDRPRWLAAAADEAYRVTADTWTRADRECGAAGRERMIARASAAETMSRELAPLYAAHWRDQLSPEGVAAADPADRDVYLKIRSGNALADLVAELSARRADLLVFREPMALSAACAHVY